MCKGKYFKPAAASNQSFLKEFELKDASEQLQAVLKPFVKEFIKENSSLQGETPHLNQNAMHMHWGCWIETSLTTAS